MRLGVDIRCLTEPHHSGVAFYTKNLLRHLFALDNKNNYFLFYNGYQAIDNPVLSEFKKYPNVSLRRFHWPNKIFNLAENFFNYPNIDKLLGGCDVFFAPNLQFVSLSKNCKKVVTGHDLSFEFYPEFLSLKRKIWHKFVNPRKFFSVATKIIAVSQNTKNDLMNIYKIPEEKIHVVYSGIDADAPRSFVPQKYILTLSTMEPRKNIESLIAAFKELHKEERFKDYQLIIAGPKGWKAKKIYHSALHVNGIKFIGYVSEAEKDNLYKNAAAFVFPSFYEGFGFPPTQALACGVPVIAAPTSSLPEILNNAALYVNPYDISEIAKALKEILNDNPLKNKLVEAGLRQAEKFTWESAARQTLAVFNSLV